LALPINQAFDPDNNLSMNRSDLIYRLAELNPQLLAKDVDLAVKVVLDAMSDALSHGGRIEIRGFGSFGLNYRPPRQGRNPKTGEIVNIPAKYMPHFKAGSATRSRVQKLFLLQVKKPSVSPDESRGLNKERP
jgi:integration host factor subunit beta